MHKNLFRKICLVSVLLAAAWVGYVGTEKDPNTLYLKIVGASGPSNMQLAAKITSAYLFEKRFLRVALPDIPSPTQQQSDTALATAVVGPAFRESNPDGATYIACSINGASPPASIAMLGRCREQLQQIAQEVGVKLASD